MLAANPAAVELFAGWAAPPSPERNLLRWMFTTDRAREVYLEWEPEARAMLGRFRLSAARFPDDPDVRALIAELRRDSEHVRDWWPRHDVSAIGSGSKKLRHPRLGPTEYAHVVLQVATSQTRPWSPTPRPAHPVQNRTQVPANWLFDTPCRRGVNAILRLSRVEGGQCSFSSPTPDLTGPVLNP